MSAGTHPAYPTHITPAESEAGFALLRLTLAPPPDSSGGAAPAPLLPPPPPAVQIYAAVLELGPLHCVVKMRGPDGSTQYARAECADPGPGTKPADCLLWQIVPPPSPDLREVLAQAGRVPGVIVPPRDRAPRT